MATPLKHRLVGTTILVALCVILLPDLLDGKKMRQPIEGEAIPLAPPFPDERLPELPDSEQWEVALEEPAQAVEPDEALPQLLPSDTLTLAADKPAVAKPVKAKPSAPAAESTPAMPEMNDTAWVIRLGAFRKKQNVEALVAKLRKAGYKAFTIPNVIEDGQLTKVYVGPNLSPRALESIQPELAKLTGLKGKINRYTPGQG